MGALLPPIRRAAVALFAATVACAATGGASGAAVPPMETPITVPGASDETSRPRAAAAGEALNGTFRLTAGACAGAPSGTWFRMIQPGGTQAGPFVQNSDSPCSDKTYTPMSPGTDGGLATGAYQSMPGAAFDSAGNGRADRITKPQRFYGVNFATATNATDPQTGVRVPAPRIERDDAGRLSGDVRAFAASWNNQHFNQGSPKPDGSTPGTTAGPRGTLDSSSGRFTLEWTSLIVGGPFNNFTGVWHFEGTFVASDASSASASPGTRPRNEGAPSTPPPRPAGAGTGETTAQTGLPFSAMPASAILVTALLGLALRRRVAPVPAPGVRSDDA